MKLKPEEAAVISDLANLAENLNSEIKQLDARVHWLKQAHATVVEKATAARELLHKADISDD